MMNLGAKWGIGARVMESASESLVTVNLLPKDAQVADLIHPVSRWWDQRIIDSNFLPFEPLRIKAIPISSVARDDPLIWSRSSDGVYSVKSGYKTLCEENQGEAASGSSSGAGKTLCSGVWKLKFQGR